MLDNPVIVREIKKTINPEMKTVVFEQEVARPVKDLNSLLNFANSGNPNFGSTTQKRVAFFNFSPTMIDQLGLKVGSGVDATLQARLVVHEFCEGDMIPEEIRSYYPVAEGYATHYTPREWKVNEGTTSEVTKRKEPKMTPKTGNQEQQPLTYGGKPIYRETHFAMLDMIKADVTLQHDNRVTGTSNAIRQASQRIVGMPELV